MTKMASYKLKLLIVSMTAATQALEFENIAPKVLEN
jgi:hypothetical protein